MNKSKGFSIIELMIAMMLGLFLSAALIGVFFSGKRSYTEHEESAHMQENARFALRYISRELTMSSFMAGMLSADTDTIAPTAVATDCGASNWATDIALGIEIVDNWQSGNVDTTSGSTLTCVSDLVTSSDVLTIKRTADQPTAEGGVGSADDGQMYVRIEDYGSTANFEYVADGGSFSDLAGQVDYWKYYAKAIYVRNYSNSSDDGIPTLCVAQLTENSMSTECLAEGVEAMQVEFGIDTDVDGNIDYFTTSPSSTEMELAISAQIYLLMRSVGTSQGYTNNTRYALGNTAINGGAAFADGYQRRVFSTTVKLRNPMRI